MARSERGRRLRNARMLLRLGVIDRREYGALVYQIRSARDDQGLPVIPDVSESSAYAV